MQTQVRSDRYSVAYLYLLVCSAENQEVLQDKRNILLASQERFRLKMHQSTAKNDYMRCLHQGCLVFTNRKCDHGPAERRS
jgi:hypothetical protein